jgi:hypothetical protein
MSVYSEEREVQALRLEKERHSHRTLETKDVANNLLTYLGIKAPNLLNNIDFEVDIDDTDYTNLGSPLFISPTEEEEVEEESEEAVEVPYISKTTNRSTPKFKRPEYTIIS